MIIRPITSVTVLLLVAILVDRQLNQFRLLLSPPLVDLTIAVRKVHAYRLDRMLIHPLIRLLLRLLEPPQQISPVVRLHLVPLVIVPFSIRAMPPANLRRSMDPHFDHTLLDPIVHRRIDDAQLHHYLRSEIC